MPALQPFDPASLVLIALLNPAVILVGLLMGRAADQWQKLIVVAFVAALSGGALVWAAAFLKLLPAQGLGGEAGLFVMQLGLGLVWAAVGFWSARRSP